MATYKYLAKNNTGQTIQGTVSAKDQAEALSELRRKNLVVLQVQQAAASAGPGKTAPSKGAFLGLSLTKAGVRAGAGVKKEELVLFARQLETMKIRMDAYDYDDPRLLERNLRLPDSF